MALYNPQNFPTGCPVLTINSVTYKTNSFSIVRGTQKANVTDEAGAPLGAIFQADFETLTAELQLATSSTALPTTATQSATTGVFTHNSESWIIESVTEPREKLGQRVVQITAQKAVS